MNKKKNQPNYLQAKYKAIKDIREQLNSENKVFISFNPKRTIIINIIIGSNGEVEPESLEY